MIFIDFPFPAVYSQVPCESSGVYIIFFLTKFKSNRMYEHRLDKLGITILLMVQKSGDHQLRLVVYPIIYRVCYIQMVVVWDSFHQQYVLWFHSIHKRSIFNITKHTVATKYLGIQIFDNRKSADQKRSSCRERNCSEFQQEKTWAMLLLFHYRLPKTNSSPPEKWWLGYTFLLVFGLLFGGPPLL